MHLRFRSPNASTLVLVRVSPDAFVNLLTVLNCVEPYTDSACFKTDLKAVSEQHSADSCVMQLCLRLCQV
jgi:hypothetical protein